MVGRSGTCVNLPYDRLCDLSSTGAADVTQPICDYDPTKYQYVNVSGTNNWPSDEGTFTCLGTTVSGSCAFDTFETVHAYCSSEPTCLGWVLDTDSSKYMTTRLSSFGTGFVSTMAIAKRFCPIMTLSNTVLIPGLPTFSISWTQYDVDLGGKICIIHNSNFWPTQMSDCSAAEIHSPVIQTTSFTSQGFQPGMYYVYYCFGTDNNLPFTACTSKTYFTKIAPLGSDCSNAGDCSSTIMHGSTICFEGTCTLICDNFYEYSDGGGPTTDGTTCVGGGVPTTTVVPPTLAPSTTDDGNFNINQNNGLNVQSSTFSTSVVSSTATVTPTPDLYVFYHSTVSQSDIPIVQNALSSRALKDLKVDMPDVQKLFETMVGWKTENISSTGQFTVISATLEPSSNTVAFLVFSSESLNIGECVGSKSFNDISRSKLATSSYGAGGTLAFHVPANVQNVYYIVDLSASNDNVVNRKKRTNGQTKMLALRFYTGATHLGTAKFPYQAKDPNQTTIKFSMVQGYFHGTATKKPVHMDCKDIGPNDVKDDGVYQELWSKYKASLSTDDSDGGENNEFEGAVDGLGEEYLFQAFQRYLQRMKYCRDTHPGPFGNGDIVKKRYLR
ncbi:UNVERIFIED_CONTAM: hypothetical protein HDU68_007674 [Siphonaria sp. JEL0065]|nr:hypothetical protein HDU68_007674 [Siphonaria sp. JEL0065]